MSNTYRAVTPAAVGMFAEGVFEADFTVAEERDWIAAGLLELVPREYLVLSNNFRVKQGDTFTDAYLIENEAALISAGHIERVDGPPAEESPKE